MPAPETTCERCLAPAHPDDGGCPHGRDLCSACAADACSECRHEAEDAAAEAVYDDDREEGLV